MSGDRAFLDVEDDEQRQRRIGGLLEHLNTSRPVSNPLLNVGCECLPGPVEPPTALLERVQAFLPAISASNEALSRQNPEDIDIENVSANEDRYIEMNLGLGVFEAKQRHDAESSSESESDSDSDSSSSDSLDLADDLNSSSSDDSDSDSQSGPVDMKPISSRVIKPLPRRVSEQTKV